MPFYGGLFDWRRHTTGQFPEAQKLVLVQVVQMNIVHLQHFTILSIVYLQQPVFYIPGELISLLQCKNESQVPKRANQRKK